MEGLLRLDKDQGDQWITQVLRGSDSALKPVAIAAVGSLRSKQASAKFAAELPHLQPQEQIWMIESLAARGDPAARAAIAQQCQPRRMPAFGARPLWLWAALAMLLRWPCLRGPSRTQPIRRSSARLETALIGLGGGARVDNAILGELTKASSNARVSFITVLARRQGPAANPVLLEEAGNPDPAVAKAAFRALAQDRSRDRCSRSAQEAG